jgi:SAM-dependent methyltransferase
VNPFNRDYFENGVKMGISGYENYCWRPTRSFSEAIELINRFNFNTILDYGCAKGFLVHALRQLGKEAYGEDISDYALENCDPHVICYLSKPSDRKVDFIFCKDVLEHIEWEQLNSELAHLRERCNQALFIVPLGDHGTFRIREYEIDKTHLNKKDEDWWISKLTISGFKIKSFSYSMGTIKEHWLSVNKYGNGFFVVER